MIKSAKKTEIEFSGLKNLLKNLFYILFVLVLILTLSVKISVNVSAYSSLSTGICACGNGNTTLGGNASDACKDCTSALNDNQNCPAQVNYVGAVKITNCSSTCIDNPENFSNKIFDCLGNLIDGDDSILHYGIYLNGESGNTIRNCLITGFDGGIFLFSSGNNTLKNNTLSSNIYGIYVFSNSSQNNISNNKISNNHEAGIIVTDYHPFDRTPKGSKNNTIQGNEILNNGIGIYSQNSNSTINSNFVCRNINSDLNSSNWFSSSGENNTCNITRNWNDTNGNPCTYSCPVIKPSSSCGCDNGTYNYSCGQNVTESCRLNCNLMNSSGTCFTAGKSGIFIDGNGYSITGNASGYGIYLTGVNNVTVKNLKIYNFSAGIYLQHSSKNSLNNNTVISNIYGIYVFDNSSFSNISKNEISNNTIGITISDCNSSESCTCGNINNTLQENEISNNRIGIYSQNSSSNITSNNVCGNTDSDFNSSDWLSSYGENNTCTTTKNWNEKGFYGCTHQCSGCAKVMCGCSSCNECVFYLNSAFCQEVNLISDITDYSGTCIENPDNFSSKIFDCKGNSIEGSDSPGSYGIYLEGKSGNTIRNCVIKYFSEGIYLYSSENNTLVENTANSNANSGIYLDSSSNNNLIRNTANSNADGIYLSGSSNNTLTNNTANFNTYVNGISLARNSSNNTLTNNTANNNRQNGLYIEGSDTANTVKSNTFCSNNRAGGEYYDIYDEELNTGENNTCKTSYNWNDTGTAGCRYICRECEENSSCSDQQLCNTTTYTCQNLNCSQGYHPQNHTCVRSIRPGDSNGDGAINIFDVIWAEKIAVGLPGPPAGNADADCNGAVNIFDVIWIEKIAVGLPGKC